MCTYTCIYSLNSHIFILRYVHYVIERKIIAHVITFSNKIVYLHIILLFLEKSVFFIAFKLNYILIKFKRRIYLMSS